MVASTTSAPELTQEQVQRILIEPLPAGRLSVGARRAAAEVRAATRWCLAATQNSASTWNS